MVKNLAGQRLLDGSLQRHGLLEDASELGVEPSPIRRALRGVIEKKLIEESETMEVS